MTEIVKVTRGPILTWRPAKTDDDTDIDYGDEHVTASKSRRQTATKKKWYKNPSTGILKITNL